jgi:cytochrome c oxidase subunit 3
VKAQTAINPDPGGSTSLEASWGGGASPFAVSWQKLMIWLFIIGDGLLFAGFLTVYGFVRLAAPTWPNRAEVFHLPLIGAMTIILITSGATMATAVLAARRDNWKMTVHFLLLTMLGGLAFLGMQAYEWLSLIRTGATLTANPWGVPLFAQSFFIITGFHGFHVLTGLLLLGIVATRASTGRSKAGGVELTGLYWAFVDVVWVFIFPVFYLV